MTTSGYWGASIGASRFDDLGCTSGLSCDKTEMGAKLFIGGMVNQWLGVELGLVDLGRANANGGDTRAHGANLGLVGKLPLNNEFSLLGKVGTIYGRTKRTASIGGVATGTENGFGLSYGLGAQYDFANSRFGVRADWDRYRPKFVNGRQDIDLYSVGFVYRF